MLRTRTRTLALTCALTLWPGASAAQSDEARDQFTDGVARFDRQDYDGALRAFTRAYELSGRASLLLNLGVTQQALGHVPEALANLRAYLAARVDRSPAQRAAAERTVQELERVVGHLRVVTEPDGAAVTIDDRVPVRDVDGDPLVAAGRHVVVASLPGYGTARDHVTTSPGERRTVRLRLGAEGSETPMARLGLEGVPRAATVSVDGEDRMPAGALTLTEGAHEITVRAPGMRPWQGQVSLDGGASRTLRVSLARDARGPSPAWFWLALGTTGALTLGAVAAGVAALDAHSDFAARDANDPGLTTIADRGRALAAAADGLGVAALVAGVASVVLFTQTDLGAHASSAELVVIPVAGGGLAAVSHRF